MKPLFFSAIALSCLGLFVSSSNAAPPKTKRKPDPRKAQIEDVAGLPRVLIVGDSISLGYTLLVREAFDGKANVHRPPTNCGPSLMGAMAIDKWLGKKKWDVIHFNFGIHDLRNNATLGKARTGPDGTRWVKADEYEKNLRNIVARLKKTRAKLIWCSTTPIPKGIEHRVVADSAEYNAIAAKIMKENGIAINDLYGFVKPQMKDLMKPEDVHFKPEGSQALSKQVISAIQKQLK